MYELQNEKTDKEYRQLIKDLTFYAGEKPLEALESLRERADTFFADKVMVQVLRTYHILKDEERAREAAILRENIESGVWRHYPERKSEHYKFVLDEMIWVKEGVKNDEGGAGYVRAFEPQPDLIKHLINLCRGERSFDDYLRECCESADCSIDTVYGVINGQEGKTLPLRMVEDLVAHATPDSTVTMKMLMLANGFISKKNADALIQGMQSNKGAKDLQKRKRKKKMDENARASDHSEYLYELSRSAEEGDIKDKIDSRFYQSKAFHYMLGKYRKYSEESEGMEAVAREKYMFTNPETCSAEEKKRIKAGRKAARYRNVLEDLLMHFPETEE